MAENEKDQAAEPVQDAEAQASGQEETAAQDKASKDENKEKDNGILMPILYALLAALGTFTLIMFIAIGIFFFKARSTPPSEQPSPSQETAAPSETAEPS